MSAKPELVLEDLHPDTQKMYHSLWETEGARSANKYLEIVTNSDYLSQRQPNDSMPRVLKTKNDRPQKSPTH